LKKVELKVDNVFCIVYDTAMAYHPCISNKIYHTRIDDLRTLYYKAAIECCGQVVGIPASYLRGPQFKSYPGNLLN
jgi:hypothetical protein